MTLTPYKNGCELTDINVNITIIINVNITTG